MEANITPPVAATVSIDPYAQTARPQEQAPNAATDHGASVKTIAAPARITAVSRAGFEAALQRFPHFNMVALWKAVCKPARKAERTEIFVRLSLY